MTPSKIKTVTVRVTADLYSRLQKAADKAKDPYAPSVTAIVERGIELALRELERKRGKP